MSLQVIAEQARPRDRDTEDDAHKGELERHDLMLLLVQLQKLTA